LADATLCFARAAAFVAFTLACGGCTVLLPSGFLSGFVLEPEKTCDELVASLRLGDLPSVADPSGVGLEYEVFSATSANGQPLNGWFIPAQWEGELDADPAGTVIILHGTSGTIACALPWAMAAAANHQHAVVFDYQGYGESGGSPNLSTLLNDADAVLGWVIADHSPARQRVHVIGISLGTGAALGLANLRAEPQIQSVTLDCPYDPEAMLGGVESRVFPFFPLFGFSARFEFAWLFVTRSRLGQMTTPLLVIAAEDDRTTPLSGAQTVFNLAGSPSKSLWVFPGLDHVQPLFLSEQEYVSLVVTFWRDPAAEPSIVAAASDPTIRVPAFTP
jgi:pimeloyl-ACP methyl ester carboxylesterase